MSEPTPLAKERLAWRAGQIVIVKPADDQGAKRATS